MNNMKKIRMGMVGGANDAFIGNVHRLAANLDGQIELVCGSFSSSYEKTLNTGTSLGIDKTRLYPTFQEMIDAEAQLPLDERMQFVSIVTPNYLHFEPAKLALQNGFHVLCEKPLAFNSIEAAELEKLVSDSKLMFGLMHNYIGYPMVKEAKALIVAGKLGKIRKVVTEYPQGWLANKLEDTGQKQADWRTDPNRAGISCCVGDIGSHAENLTEYITGLQITEVAADVTTFVEGRLLDDDANILVRFNNGAKGVIIASQIAIGEENELKINVYGEKGSLEWLQSEPNKLIFKNNGPQQIITSGAGYPWLSEASKEHIRLPGGHPEGYLEGMANLYRNFAKAIRAGKMDELFDFPTVQDGVRGMKFIEAVIESGVHNSKWIKLS